MKSMVCIGDSLTEGTDIPTGHTWPALVANALNIDVINCGIGGDTTTGMLSRFYPEVVGIRLHHGRDKRFVVELGSQHDSRQSFLHDRPGPAPRHGAGHRPSLTGQRHRCTGKRFFSTSGGYDRFTEKMEATVKDLIRHATESEVAVVDLHHPFFEENRRIRTDLLLPDGLHPNKAGHRTIAREITSVFRQDLNFP